VIAGACIASSAIASAAASRIEWRSQAAKNITPANAQSPGVRPVRSVRKTSLDAFRAREMVLTHEPLTPN